MNWYLGVLKQYTVFTGRSRRTEYWMFVLFSCIISIVISILSRVPGLGFIGGALSMIYALGVLVPSIAVAVRRMHDTNHSGWWLLVPLVNLIFACTDSQPGPNEYGPNPKGV